MRKATSNALIGDAVAIAAQMAERFHPEDRLMLWFDFNNHDSKRVMKNMSGFMTDVGRVLNPSAAAERPPSSADGLRTRPTS